MATSLGFCAGLATGGAKRYESRRMRKLSQKGLVKISRSNPGVYQDAGLGRMFPRSDVEAAIPAKFVGFHLDGVKRARGDGLGRPASL